MRTERSRTSITEALGEDTIGLAMPDALSEFIFNLMPGDSDMVRVESGSRTPPWPQKEVNILIDSVTSH